MSDYNHQRLDQVEELFDQTDKWVKTDPETDWFFTNCRNHYEGRDLRQVEYKWFNDYGTAIETITVQLIDGKIGTCTWKNSNQVRKDEGKVDQYGRPIIKRYKTNMNKILAEGRAQVRQEKFLKSEEGQQLLAEIEKEKNQ